MMSRLVYLLVLCGLAQSAPRVSETTVVNPVLTKCLAEVELASDYRIRNFTEAIISEPKARCLIGCLWRENKWLRDDGSLDPTKWIEMMPKSWVSLEEPIKAVTECSKENDNDLCEMVFKFVVCYNAKKLAALYNDPIDTSTTPLPVE